MTNIEIRDRTGYLIGTVAAYTDWQELRDRHGFYLGKYDSRSDETRDRKGSLVGTGNLLMTLIPTN